MRQTWAVYYYAIRVCRILSHLGHIINAKLEDNNDIIKRHNDFIGQVNNIRAKKSS